MTRAKKQLRLVEFDAARYLDDDAAIAEYMTAVVESDDPDLLRLALGDVARAIGMAQVAKDAGLGELAARFTGKGSWKKRLPQIVYRLEALGRLRRQGARVAGVSEVSGAL